MESVKRYWSSEVIGLGVTQDQWTRAADFDRVSAENLALQQRLTVQDQRVDELQSALKFYAEREHYHFESGNWDTVSGEPLNILWCGDEPDLIEDGSVARAALKPTAEAEPQCLLCLDKKTVPGNIPGGFVKDCPDCCSEEG